MDYATQLWNKFVTSIGNMNVEDGVSYARYWSLILQYVYEKERILVLEGEETVEFPTYHYQKIIEDDVDIFPTVARIPDVMLQKVDPTNPVLIEYLKNVNTSVETRKLLEKSNEDSSKKRQGSKKKEQASPSKSSPEKVEMVEMS